ncbi:MAG: glycosyltransferase family 39 protein [Deltaproteobacteria bacterium]|nr:glycosyltransferase family 39 protein [Deltaproteobacteria bacterium]
MTASLSRRDRRWAIAVAVTAAVFFALLARYGLNIGEEGGTAYLIGRTAAGQRPYLDFATGYTPGYFCWHAFLLRLLGNNLLVLRASLVVVNSLTVAWLFVVARALLPRRWALLAALIYPALLPVVPDLSCSFNVPYPAWYTLLFLVVSVWALLRWSDRRHLSWLGFAGLLAGLSFSFKPTSGLFHLAAATLVVVCDRGAWNAPERRGLDRWFGTLAILGSLGGILLVLRSHLAGREALIFALPILAAVAAWMARPAGQTGQPSTTVAALLSLWSGFVLVTAPWMAWYEWQLGWAGFAHDVLFLNTGYEQFFFQAYRPLAVRDLLVAVLSALLFGLPIHRLRAGLRPPRLVAVLVPACVAITVWVLGAPMPEGFQPAVLMRLQDAAFGAVIVIHVALVAWLWRAARRRDREATALMIVGLAALCCFLSTYPRSDFFHLSCAAALSWVVGVAALWRVSRRWCAALPGAAAWIDRGARSAILVTLAIVAWPQMQLAAAVAQYTLKPASSSLVPLGLDRAPLLVRRGVAPSVRDLAPVVAYLRSAPGSGLFTFPNLDLLCFLSGRDTPARIGYFNPGWPDHLVEAEVVDALQTRPPELAVVADPASLFFADAPAYYVLLGQFLRRQYVPVGRVGSYTLLRRRELGAAPPTAPLAPVASACDDSLVAQNPALLEVCLDRAGSDVRRLLQQVRGSESVESAAVVADWWRRGGANAARGLSLLALRIVGELGDVSSAAPLLQTNEPQDVGEHEIWASALFNIALRALIEPFQFGRVAEGPLPALFDETRMRQWLEQGDDARLRFFAAWALGQNALANGPSSAAAVSLLRRTFDGNELTLRLVAASALVRLSDDPQIPQRLLAGFDSAQTLLPGLLFEWQRRHRQPAEAFLDDALRSAPGEQKELMALLAGALARRELASVLGGLMSSAAPRLRSAAVWALGQSRNPAALPLVHAAEADADARVRRLAAAARRRLEEDAGSS